jgi:hypothetical protein
VLDKLSPGADLDALAAALRALTPDECDRLGTGNRAEVWSRTKRRGRWACRRQRLDVANVAATEESDASE